MSYNNEAIISPTIDHYSKLGIIFDNFYAQPKCSPSRAALMTGKYPFRTGFNVGCMLLMTRRLILVFDPLFISLFSQKGALGWKQKAGLELRHQTIAEELQGQGYVSHMVGK